MLFRHLVINLKEVALFDILIKVLKKNLDNFWAKNKTLNVHSSFFVSLFLMILIIKLRNEI